MREANRDPIEEFLDMEENPFEEQEDTLSPEFPPPSEEAAAETPQQAVETVAEPQNPAEPPPASAAEEPSEAVSLFDMAFSQGNDQSCRRLIAAAAAQKPLFSYESAEAPIEDESLTFEQLRRQYMADFPALAEPKSVSWNVVYGKISKYVSMPGSTRIYDVKAEIEQSPEFMENMRKAKKEADRHPQCLVKPHVKAQVKGELPMPAYKGYCDSEEEAKASPKPLTLFPTKDGLYQMRKNNIGTFVAPADPPEPHAWFRFGLPLIPICLLYTVIHFFREWAERGMEVLVHILYDTATGDYIVNVPPQKVTETEVDAVLPEPYPDTIVHVMDFHSHNWMEADFSATDDNDEKATRLYGVCGRLDKPFPDIRIRAGCGGKFIDDIPMDEIFDVKVNGYPYPAEWNNNVQQEKNSQPKTRSRWGKLLPGKWRKAL